MSEDVSKMQTKKLEKLKVLHGAAIKKMWVIILSLAACNLFVYIYSQILFCTDDCRIPGSSVFVFNVTQITERFV